MSDAAKHIERAEKFLDKGKPESALEEYRAAVELLPRNEQLLQKIADLSLSIGQLGLATDMLRRLFAIFIESKQISNAGVAFRKLQRIKALEPEMVKHYAELCVSTNRKDAAEAYRIGLFRNFNASASRAAPCNASRRRLSSIHESRISASRPRIAEALHETSLAAGRW